MKNAELQAFLDEERGNTEALNEVDARHLLKATEQCRASMHEPDEQDIEAEVTAGSKSVRGYFDNAGGVLEMALHLKDSGRKMVTTINMADLVAFARIGARAYLNAHGLK